VMGWWGGGVMGWWGEASIFLHPSPKPKAQSGYAGRLQAAGYRLQEEAKRKK